MAHKAWTVGGSLMLAFAWIAVPLASQEIKGAQVRTEIPYSDGTVVLLSDSQKKISKSRYRAEGRVAVSFQDIMVTGEKAEYDEETREGFMEGPARFSQGETWLSCSRAEFDFGSQTGVFYNASGYTDREFLINSRTIRKTGENTYRVEKIDITACKDKPPKWSLAASRAEIRADKVSHLPRTTRLRNTTFRIKGVPVFYFPYLIVPMEKKARSSGFIPFHTGTSTSKGRVFSEGYYQTLGPSADFLIYGDYFSLRGVGIGGIFRTRPNPETRFDLEVYGIKIVEQVPLLAQPGRHNINYLRTKKNRLGHILDEDL